MDLSIPIVGLMALIGYQINDKKTPRTKENLRKEIQPNEKPSGRTVYHSTFSKQIESSERGIADNKFQKSKSPAFSNIIPPLYNSFTQGTPVKETTQKPVQKPVQGFSRGTAQGAPAQGLSQVTTQKEHNAIPMSRMSEFTGKENFSNISKLTGKETNMSHNNMVPFFGSNVTQNTELYANSSILENYTGKEDTPMRKTENPKMFENTKQNIHGLDVGISKDRFEKSLLKTNLLPAPQVKVQPLPEEYVRPSYKKVDELRVNSNPKMSYVQPVIPGKHYVSTRGIQSKVSKNRPDKFYKNGPERYFTNVGEVKGPTARERFVNCNKVKAQVAEVTPNMNPAYDPTRSAGKSRYVKRGNNDGKVNNLTTITEDDKRQTYRKDWVRNAKHEIKKHNEISRKGYTAIPQERETTNRMTILPANDTRVGVRQHNTDQARTTTKEGNLFSYNGNAVSEVEKQQDYTGAYNYTREKQWINNPDYKGTPGENTKSIYNTDQYDNAHVSTNRQEISDRRGYMAGGQKENIPLGVQGVNIHTKEEPSQFNHINTGGGPGIRLYESLGKPTNVKETAEHDFADRVDPGLMDAFNKNPYTKPLNSY